MTAPIFPLAPTTQASGPAVTMALTLVPGPDNLVVGDLDLQKGQIHFWDKNKARFQKVRTILQFGKGEWFINPNEGIPYFGSVIIGSKNKSIPLSIIRQAFLKGLPDLAQIRTLNLAFDAATRTAKITFELAFDDGFVLKSSDFAPLEIKL
jgi:hypothetical protein